MLTADINHIMMEDRLRKDVFKLAFGEVEFRLITVANSDEVEQKELS